jgi:hypothetical protein
VVFRRQLRRGQILPFFKKQRPCLVGMEACAACAPRVYRNTGIRLKARTWQMPN